MLAEAATQVDDLTWSLNFRQGVMFHDGTEMKASDFKFTMDLLQNPDTASLFANFLTPIAGVDATGDYSATVHLNEPFGLFPERLFVMSVLPEVTFSEMGIDRFGLAPVGTGPFAFQNMIAQDRVELARHADYFDEGLPLLDSITFREVPEASVAHGQPGREPIRHHGAGAAGKLRYFRPCAGFSSPALPPAPAAQAS